MSQETQVSVHGLSKAFALRQRKRIKGLATDLTDSLTDLLRNAIAPRNHVEKPERADRKFLFALDDVSFDVAAGEVVGIIGRNGAGKSTLLKILARVLEPTEGRVAIRGRVASIMELGIGFAPELTLRENIEIYGRLSGLRMSRIRALEENILSIARLTGFRDEVLSKCPSGSFVQLAFAAMISMDANVILADEVLTVGDSSFRHACENHIRAASSSGKVVLFVSHDMNAVRRACSRVLWIDKGRIRQDGPTDEVVSHYTAELLAGSLSEPSLAEAPSGCRILELRLLNGEGEQIGALQMTEPAYLDCIFRLDRPSIVNIQFELRDEKGRWHILTTTTPTPVVAPAPATFRAGIRIPAHFLNDVRYRVRCRLYSQPLGGSDASPVVAAEEQLNFTVMNPRPEHSVWADWRWGRPGLISPKLQWIFAPQGCAAADAVPYERF